MNWFKMSQYNPVVPMQISSYDYTYNRLYVLFRGKGPYMYPNVSPFIYNKITTLLRHRNYSSVKAILDKLSLTKNPPDHSKEEKEDMLNQLYEEGYLK